MKEKVARSPVCYLRLACKLSLACLLCATCVSAQLITTIAGTDFLFPTTSVLPANAPLGHLVGMAIDTAGNIYVADAGNNMVMRVSRGGVLQVIAGNGKTGFSGDGGPAVSASLDFIDRDSAGMAIDAMGNLYIPDTINSRVRKVSPDGIITTVAGNGSAAFSGDGGPATSASLRFPNGVAVDSAGDLYIADWGNQRVRKVTPDGTITTVAGNGTSGFSGDGGPATGAKLDYPAGVAIDPVGNLYIADSSHVRKVSPNGTITSVITDLRSPSGMAFDRVGNLYIAEQFSNSVLRVSPSGINFKVAGNGTSGFAGDGGPAMNAALNFPVGVALDADGDLYIADSSNSRIRKVLPNGIITTLAGNGAFRFSGDGGPATNATLNLPAGVALDAKGNLYLADSNNNRIRKVATNGTITTIAGNGLIVASSGDGGLATNAAIFSPSGLAVDAQGNIYFSAVRQVGKVTPDGKISTIAGNGKSGFSVDGQPASSAALTPAGLAVDATGALYIAGYFDNRIYKVSADGTIKSVAGNGAKSFSGDEGLATSASLNYPVGVAVDIAGNVFIADTENHRVRKVAPGGTITTIAGIGTPGFSGDGGPATNAALSYPHSVAVDANGNLYVADWGNQRIRRISPDGTILTIVGSGVRGFSGDGGTAPRAALNSPSGVATDAAGNLYIADTDNHRVRKVIAIPASYQAVPANLSFSAVANGQAPAVQPINVSSTVPGLAFTTLSSAPWLAVSPISGSMPSSLQASVDPSNLTPGIYQGTITITAPDAAPDTAIVSVTFTVQGGAGPQLRVDSQNLTFSALNGGADQTGQVRISNSGDGSLAFTATATTVSGGAWLSLTPANGTATPSSAASLTITVAAGSLSPGTYQGNITIAGAGSIATVAVTLSVSDANRVILVSQSALSFVAAAQGGVPLPQNFGILNSGQGSMSWSASATTLSGGGNWLQISPTSGTVDRPFLDVSPVNVTIDPTGLAPGDYYGRIQVSAAAANSPQAITVVLTVLPPGSNPGPELRPTGLIFIGAAGVTPSSQDVLVGNPKAQADSFLSGTIGKGFTYLPTNANVLPSQPQTVRVYPDYSSLRPGTIERGTITLQFSDGTPRFISVLSVVAPAGGVSSSNRNAARTAGGCQPTNLYLVVTQLGSGSSVPVGWPVTVQARVVDDCGTPMTTGSVVATFSNGDPPLPLINIQDGRWTSTWQPRNTTIAGVTVSIKAQQPDLNLSGSVSATIGLQGNLLLPVLSGAPLSAVALVVDAPLAPGALMLIQGSRLSDGEANSSSSPLAQQLAGASVIIGGRRAPLLHADDRNLIWLVPLDLSVNTQQQLVVQRGTSFGVPSKVVIAATQPAVFSKDGSGQGQGLIYQANAGAAATLADASNPVTAGDKIVIYCAGLGALDEQGGVLNPVSVSIGGQPAPVTYAGMADQNNLPPDGPPAIISGLVSSQFIGFYQVTATVPDGVADGQAVLSISVAGQSSQPGTTMWVGRR